MTEPHLATEAASAPAWRGRAVGAAVWLAALALAWWAAGGVMREDAIEARQGFRPSEQAWMAPVPRALRGGIDPFRAVVLEDGRPLFRLTSRRAVDQGDWGVCYVRGDVVVLVAGDGSDPNTNGKTYRLRAPASLPWGWIAAGLIGVAAASRWAGRGMEPAAAAAPWNWRWGTGVFLASLVARGLWLWCHRDYSDGFMMAKGCPYSDAQVWLELTRSLLDGRGLEGPFAGQRPLYPVLLAPMVGMGLPEMVAAQALNAIAGAVMAAVLAGLVAPRAGRGAAVALAAWLSLGGEQMTMLPLAMSETPATAMAAVAMAAAWTGATTGRLRWLWGAGVFFGLANLACTFTPVVWVLVGGLCGVWLGWDRRCVRTTVGAGGLVALGAAMVLLPWVLRQRAVYGVTTLSLQAAEMLYAPVSPSGRYGAALVREPNEAGVPDTPGDRFRYFSTQWREKVIADPAGYFRVVAGNAAESLAYHGFGGPVNQSLLILAAIAVAWRRARCGDWRPWAAAMGAVGLIWWNDRWPPGAALGAAALGALISPRRETRRLAALAVAFVVGVAAMDGLTGNSITRRFVTASEGAVMVLGVLAIARLVDGLTTGLRRIGRPVPAAAGIPSMDSEAIATCSFFRVSLIGVAVWTAVSTIWVLIATARGPVSSPPAAAPAAVEQAWQEWRRRERVASLPAGNPSRFWAEAIEFTDRGCILAAGENIHHWSRAFTMRDEPRTVVFVRTTSERRLWCAQVPGATPVGRRSGGFLLLAVRSVDPTAHLGHEKEILEVLAIIPLRGGGLDLESAEWFAPSAEARRIMEG